MSHQKALGQAQKFGGVSIIFEDDNYPLIPLPDIQAYITQALHEAPPSWDMIYLGWCSEVCSFEQPVSPHLQTAIAPLCTHAFALSSKGAVKVAQVLRRGGQPNDVDLRMAILDGQLEAYKTAIPLFDQIKNLGETAAQKISVAMGTTASPNTTGLSNSHNLNPQTRLCHPEAGSNFRSVVSNMLKSMQGWREKMVTHRASSLQGRKQLKLLVPQSAVAASGDVKLQQRMQQLGDVANATQSIVKYFPTWTRWWNSCTVTHDVSAGVERVQPTENLECMEDWRDMASKTTGMTARQSCQKLQRRMWYPQQGRRQSHRCQMLQLRVWHPRQGR